MLFPLNDKCQEDRVLDSLAIYFDLYELEVEDCNKLYTRSDLKKIITLLKNLSEFKQQHIIQKMSLFLHERVYNDFIGMIPREVLETCMVRC
jgi:hypothetical protein